MANTAAHTTATSSTKSSVRRVTETKATELIAHLVARGLVKPGSREQCTA